MLTADGAHPVLMDLGLAQLADETDGRLTRTRQFVGTLRYASPEQVLAAGPVDRRTDVYSLGATLWELLTLRPTYGAGDDMPTPDLMLKIQTTDLEKPRKYNPHVPRDLEAIVMKCVEKDRARRYATAADLADDLGRFLGGEPVTAQPPSFGYLAGKFVRRYRVPLAAAAFVLLLLGVGLLVAFLQIRSERNDAVAARLNEEKEKDRAQQALSDLQRSRKEAEVVWNVVDQAYSAVKEDNIRHLAGLSPVHEELAKIRLEGMQQLAQVTPDDPTVLPRLARAHAILGVISSLVGRLDRATTNLERAAALYEQLEQRHPDEPTYRLLRTRALYELGYALYTADLYEKARQPIERAVALAEDALKKSPDDPALLFEMAQGSLRLASVLPAKTENDRKISLLVKSRDLYDRLVGLKHRPADSLLGRGMATYNLFWQTPESGDDKAQAKMLEAEQKDYAAAAQLLPESPFIAYFTATSLLDQGELAERSGPPSQAQAHFDRAIALMRQAVKNTPEAGRYAAQLAESLGKLARNLQRQGKLAQARAAFEECRQLLATQVAKFDDRPEYARLLIEQRKEFADFIDSAKAIADPVAQAQEHRRALDQAVADGRKLSARFPDHPRLNAVFASALVRQVQVEATAGRTEQAARLANEAVEVYRVRVIPHEPPGARAYAILSDLESVKDALLAAKRDEDLLTLGQMALELAPHASRAGKDSACGILMGCGKVHERAQRAEEAIKTYRQVLEIAAPALEKDPWHWYLRTRVFGANRDLADIYRQLKDSRNEVLCLREQLRVWYEPMTPVQGKQFLAPGRPEDAAEAAKIRAEIERRAGGMKGFTIPCDFNGIKYPFHIYVTDLKYPKHPLEDQARWLLEERGGRVPPEVMDAFGWLHKMAYEDNVSLQDLCVYALGTAAAQAGAAPRVDNVDSGSAGTAPAGRASSPSELARRKAGAADLRTQFDNSTGNREVLIELVRAYVELGNEYLEAGQPADAVVTFEYGARALDKALPGAPQGPVETELLARTLWGLQRGYVRHNQPDKAVVALLRFVELADQQAQRAGAGNAPGRPAAKGRPLNWPAERLNGLVALGDLFRQRQEPLEAARWYHKGIDLGSPAAARSLGQLALEYPPAIQMVPEDTRALFQQAQAQEKVNLSAIPDRFAALVASTRAAREKQARESAVKQQFADFGQLADQHHRLAEEYQSQGKWDDALKWLREEARCRQQQAKLLPGDTGLKAAQANNAYALAVLCARQGLAKEAVQWMEKAVEGGHEQAAFDWADWHAQGKLVEKQPDRARLLLAMAHFQRGNRLFKEARYADALPDFKAVTEQAPQFAGGFNKRAMTCGKLGKRDEAIAGYRRSYELDRSETGTVLNLLEAFLAGGRAEDLTRFAAGLDKRTWDPPAPHAPEVARRLALFNGLQAIALRLTTDGTSESEPEKKLFALTTVPGFKVDGWTWGEIEGWLAKAGLAAPKEAAVRRIIDELKGIPQPRTTPLYPLAVGARWVYDAKSAQAGVGYEGEVVVRVAAKEKVNGVECYKLVRSQGEIAKPTEHVVVRYDGVYLVARDGTPLTNPYRFLALPAQRGTSWLSTGPSKEGRRLGILVGDIETPAGKFEGACVVRAEATGQSQKAVVAGGNTQTVWYVENLGPVKLESQYEHNKNVLTLTLKKYYPPEVR
jgi:tetratricopeptide (TPR) repeat protein